MKVEYSLLIRMVILSDNLKWILPFALAFMFIGCSTVDVQEKKDANTSLGVPTWYGTLHLNNNEIIGYGEGRNRQIAKEQALQDIASQLSVSVSSTTHRKVEDLNGSLFRKRSQNIRLETHQQIENAIIIKEFRLANGYTYIAYQLSLLELDEIFAQTLLKSWGNLSPKKVEFTGMSWLSHAPFSKKLAKKLENTSGTGKRYVNLELHRKHNAWVLSVNDVSRIINQSDLENIVAWQQTEDDDFQLSLVKFDKDRGRNRLKRGDRFAIELKSSDANGFYTLFNIYPDGQLVAIEDSHKLSFNQMFPNKQQQKQGLILVAETLEKGKVSEDVLLAVKSDHPLDTTMFRQASESREKYGHHLHKLLTWLDRNEIKTVSILRVEIQPE